MRFVGGNMTKYVSKALMAMLVISILPGCGKKNDAVATNNGVAAAAAINTIGSGGCASVTNNGSAQTLTFSGTLNPAYGGVSAQLPVYGYGTYTGGYGSSFWRTDYSGDRVDLYISGNSSYAVATLSALTIQTIVAAQSGGYGYYGGYNNATSQVCGLDISATFVSGGQSTTNGTLSGVFKMWSNGRWITYANGSPILL